jgi:hypothetical protein
MQTPSPPETKQAITYSSISGTTVTLSATSPPETKPAIADRPTGNTGSSAPSALPELGQLEQRRESLEARAFSINTGLHKLQQAQAAQGLSLRGDITASRQRMQTNLYEAKSALKEQDVSRARECLDRAETEVVNLEKFLGH